jgi:hypothetical protein
VEDAVFDPTTGTTHDFLTGPSEPPSPRESGWKDTFVAPPGKVTRVRIRFAPQYSKESQLVPGQNPFPFDPTAGPGYVWHCHILDHEDNDMMRPMKMVAVTSSVASKHKARGSKVSRSAPPVPAKPAHTGMGTMQMQQKLMPR